MPPPNWNDDNELIRDLGAALRAGPPGRPDPLEQMVVDAAETVRRWLTSDPDLELAVLLYDSTLDRRALVRDGAEPPRTLVFCHGGRHVEIEIDDGGIEGQLVPPGPGTVRLQTVSGTSVETTADEVGCFHFALPHRVPVRIECVVGDDRIRTGWIAT